MNRRSFRPNFLANSIPSISLSFCLSIFLLTKSFPSIECAINGQQAQEADHHHSMLTNSGEMEFMQKLFDQFKNHGGEATTASFDKNQANTVIGYTPTVRDRVCNTTKNEVESKGTTTISGLEFKLNELKPGERLIRAELHLFHRQISQFPSVWSMPGKFRRFYSKTKPTKYGLGTGHITVKYGKCNEIKQIWMERSAHWMQQTEMKMAPGWVAYNAIQPVKQALDMENGKLFLQLLHLNFNKNVSVGELDRLVHYHRPFLTIYTNNQGEMEQQQQIDEKHSWDVKRTKRDVRATLSSYGSEDEIRQHMETARKTAEYYAYGMARPNPLEQEMPIATMRDEKTKTSKGKKAGPRNWHEEGPAAFLRRRKLKHQQRRRKIARSYPGFDPNDPMLGFGTAHSPWDRKQQQQQRLLQQSLKNIGNSLDEIRVLQKNSYNRVGQKEGELEGEKVEDDGEDMKQQQQQAEDMKVMLLGSAENEEGEMRGGMAQQREKKSKCTRHNLTLDFGELGWAKRIIAPKQYEADFCAGSCDYPLDKDVHHSNHAILQSLLVHQRRAHHQNNGNQQNGQPPAVCCTPEKFDSLTLLYFDENDNVVLKNYPRMSVLECGCI